MKKYLEDIDTLEYIDIPKDAYNIWNGNSIMKDIKIPKSFFTEYNELLDTPVYISVINIEKYQKDGVIYNYNKNVIRIEFQFENYFNKIILFDYEEIMNKFRIHKIRRLI